MTQHHSTALRLAVTFAGGVLLSTLVLFATAEEAPDEEARQAVVEALPERFPVPGHCRLLGKELGHVKIGVKKMNMEELVAFLETGLKKAGYQIVMSEGSSDRARLGPDIEGWTIGITPPDGKMQGIQLERDGDELYFVAKGRE
jgi:hypothetical protein